MVVLLWEELEVKNVTNISETKQKNFLQCSDHSQSSKDDRHVVTVTWWSRDGHLRDHVLFTVTPPYDLKIWWFYTNTYISLFE